MVGQGTTSTTSCQSCGASPAKLFRCQGCRQVLYCSVPCQRVDRRQHKRFCRSWAQLQHLTLTAPLNSAEHDYHVAKQAVVDLVAKEKAKAQELAGRVASSISIATKQQQQRQLPSSTPATIHPRQDVPATSNGLPLFDTKNRIASTIDNWRVTVEDMPHLTCLQVVMALAPPWEQLRRGMRMEATVEMMGQSKSKVVLSSSSETNPSVTLVVPRRLDANAIRSYPMGSSSSSSSGGTLTIRLGYVCDDDPVAAVESTPPLLPPSAVEHLCCNSCGWPLLLSHESRDASIQRVLPLPSPGRWDDMQDYLVCYEGLATFDFEHITSQPETLLEDTTMLVFHHASNTTVQSLSVPTYGRAPFTASSMPMLMDGDALVRGTRPWHPGNAATAATMVDGSAAAGTTLTCGQCAQVMGFTTTSSAGDAVRIYKHQLRLLESSVLQRVSTFVAHELVRYAETKAIFTFAVLHASSSQCMYVRLVSWDSFSAAAVVESHTASDDTTGGFLDCCQQWYRTAKLLFEVTERTNSKHVAGGLEEDSIWLWTEADLCCPPPTSGDETATAKELGKAASSVVEMHLEDDEWRQLVDEMEAATELIPDEVRLATIAAKLGRAANKNERIGLTAILLS